jgi:hypothetical protein
MKNIKITRREFIATTSLATSGAILANAAGPIISNTGAIIKPGLSENMEPWYDRTMRWVQIIFTEGDTGEYDPQW